jgi:hypothetical protein
MRLTAPTQALFIVSLVLMVLALAGYLRLVPLFGLYPFWLAVVGWAVLAFACMFRRA